MTTRWKQELENLSLPFAEQKTSKYTRKFRVGFCHCLCSTQSNSHFHEILKLLSKVLLPLNPQKKLNQRKKEDTKNKLQLQRLANFSPQRHKKFSNLSMYFFFFFFHRTLFMQKIQKLLWEHSTKSKTSQGTLSYEVKGHKSSKAKEKKWQATCKYYS
jgi:hypothetical protein